MILYKQDMWNADEAICLYRLHGMSAHNKGGSAIHHHHGILLGKLYICHITNHNFISNQLFQKWQRILGEVTKIPTTSILIIIFYIAITCYWAVPEQRSAIFSLFQCNSKRKHGLTKRKHKTAVLYQSQQIMLTDHRRIEMKGILTILLFKNTIINF